MSQLNFTRGLLYDLKKDYPTEINIYQYTSVVNDQQIGKRTAIKKVTNVRKAILLPFSLSRKFIYDRAYISGNKNFTYGGVFDLSSRLVLIDMVDLPPKFELTVEDYVVVNDKRYQIKSAELMEGNYGYLISIQETKGALPYSVIPISVNQSFRIYQESLCK